MPPLDSHDPTLEPYASMDRDELLALMCECENGRDEERWAFLHRYFQDKLTPGEIRAHEHAMSLHHFLMREYDVDSSAPNPQNRWLAELAGGIVRIVMEDMPPVGPPEVCN